MRGSRSARIAQEHGFTLVELMVTMLVSIVVLGAGTWGIAMAFKQNASIGDRTAAAAASEVGLERLTHDLRNAVNTSTGCTASGTTVTGVSIAAPTPVVSGVGVYEVGMCEPTGTPGSNGTANLGTQLVTWTCNTTTSSVAAANAFPAAGAWTCARATNGTGSGGFGGVETLSLTGLVGTGTTPVSVGTTVTATSYTLGAGSSSLSWLGINAQIGVLSKANGVTTLQSTSAVPVQTGVELRNFGTA